MTIFRRPWTLRAVALVVTGSVIAVAVATGWAFSRQNSVWVYRYPAVVVGPLILALAVGLAEGGRVAVTALAIAVILFAPIGVNIEMS